MKKMKYLRTWLVAALVVTIIGSLTGGTVAWFTDNVESTNNVVQSGTLDIDIELLDGSSWISLEKNPNTKVFDYTLWEPGFTQVETMKIVNRGNLALEYILNVKTTGADTTPDGTKTLANAIDVYMSFGEFAPSEANAATTREALKAAKEAGLNVSVPGNNWWYAGNLADLMTNTEGFTQGAMLPKVDGEDDGVLEPGLMQGSCTCTIALHMQEEAGNEFQNLSLGNVGFILKARQHMYEKDSFDEKYDNDADWPKDGDAPVINLDLPVAGMTNLEGNDLTVTLGNGLGTLDGVPASMRDGNNMTLDCGLVFTATQEVADIAGKPYEKWNADFTVTVNKDITAEDCQNGIVPLVLAGQYDTFGAEWIPIPVTANDEFSVAAGESVRLLTMAGAPWTYEDILNYVTKFQCGVKADPSWATAGTTIQVALRVFEVVDGEETGNSYVVRGYTHTY